MDNNKISDSMTDNEKKLWIVENPNQDMKEFKEIAEFYGLIYRELTPELEEKITEKIIENIKDDVVSSGWMVREVFKELRKVASGKESE